jgi:hypothetical protein
LIDPYLALVLLFLLLRFAGQRSKLSETQSGKRDAAKQAHGVASIRNSCMCARERVETLLRHDPPGGYSIEP